MLDKRTRGQYKGARNLSDCCICSFLSEVYKGAWGRGNEVSGTNAPITIIKGAWGIRRRSLLMPMLPTNNNKGAWGNQVTLWAPERHLFFLGKKENLPATNKRKSNLSSLRRTIIRFAFERKNRAIWLSPNHSFLFCAEDPSQSPPLIFP